MPVCFALVGGRVYSAVDEKPKRTPRLQRLANVEAEPRVALLADAWSEDWTQLWWVRADGRAHVVTDPAERERALDLLAAKYEQYRLARPRGAVLAVDVTRWSSWRASP